MTDAPIAQTIHDGRGTPPEWRRKMIAEWLAAHSVRPKDVSADHPILILNMPYRDQADEASNEDQWTLQVISFVQYIRNEEDNIAAHPETGRPLTIQRTVPLQHAFPTDPTTDGEDHGEEPQVESVEEGQRPPEHEGGPESDERQELCFAEAEEVQDRRSCSRSERVGQGVAARLTSAEEGRPEGRGAQVPESEEVQKEEVEGGR